MLLDNIYTNYQQCFYIYQRYKVIERGINEGFTYTHYIYKITTRTYCMHRELYSILCNNLYGKRDLKNNEHMYNRLTLLYT